ncbi:hypothetical protein PTKIN_Ptkin18bG0119000 [Pterospermum kingtungense]
MDVVSKVALLEARVEEMERDQIESLLKTNNEHRASRVKVLQDLLDFERAAHADANDRAEALSLQLQAAQSNRRWLSQELTKHNFGGELLALRNPNKKEILALYEKCVLQKS